MTSTSANPYQSPVSGDRFTESPTLSGSMAPRLVTLVAMILAAAATRIAPHPWNFTAVGAMCLFGGAYFRRTWQALLVPLAALVLSDIVLAATAYGFGTFGYTSIWVGYGIFSVTVLIGTLLRGRVNFAGVTAAAVGCQSAVLLRVELRCLDGGTRRLSVHAGRFGGLLCRGDSICPKHATGQFVL